MPSQIGWAFHTMIRRDTEGGRALLVLPWRLSTRRTTAAIVVLIVIAATIVVIRLGSLPLPARRRLGPVRRLRRVGQPWRHKARRTILSFAPGRR